MTDFQRIHRYRLTASHKALALGVSRARRLNYDLTRPYFTDLYRTCFTVSQFGLVP